MACSQALEAMAATVVGVVAIYSGKIQAVAGPGPGYRYALMAKVGLSVDPISTVPAQLS